MDFVIKIRKRNPKKVLTDSLSEQYPSDLQMYAVPPENEISLSEFEDLAIERLQLLRTLEQVTQKGHKLYSDDWLDALRSDLKKQRSLVKFYNLIPLQENAVSQMEKLQARRADHISHFILRLAYCRSEDLRRWFLAREQEWFKARFMHMQNQPQSQNTINTFLESQKLIYVAISSDEKQKIRNELSDSTAGVDDIEKTEFYKIPFTEVCSLVSNRRVYLQSGFAYIPSVELVTCILTIFRANLSEALAYASRKIPALDDDRVNKLVTNLHTSYTGRDYSTPEIKGSINVEHLDYYARKHYPLCMRHIHEVFRATHHMKHGCRLQYGLFIKGIGVSFDDAMRFWREEFTKLIDENEFDKKYAYNVKHQYGKVGGMVSYSPYSCMKIITGSVGSGEHHGCPFRHFDATNLQQKMTEYGINTKGIEEIMELIKNRHYQVACTKYFEYTHGQPSKNTITHPNQYFEESKSLVEDTSINLKSGKTSVSTTNEHPVKKPKQSVDTENLDEIFNQDMEF